jgi:hypothetical protein
MRFMLRLIPGRLHREHYESLQELNQHFKQDLRALRGHLGHCQWVVVTPNRKLVVSRREQQVRKRLTQRAARPTNFESWRQCERHPPV